MSGDISIDNMMQKALEIPGLLSLAAGFTDNSLLPRKQIRAICDDLLSKEENNEILQYGLPVGRRILREQIAQRLLKQDIACGASPANITALDTVITSGSQQALFVTIQALCQPGDVVLVEEPTYFVFLDVLRTLGVRAIAMPSQQDVIDTDALDAFFAQLKADGEWERVRAVYIISYFSNPTGQSLPRERKEALLQAMRTHRLHVPLIEDVAYREFYFEKPWPAPSLLEQDSPEIPVLLTGTLTKLFSTGLRTGWLILREPTLRTRIIDLKRCQDFGSAHFPQAICEEAISRGILDDYLDEVRPIYHAKAMALHEALLENGLDTLGWTWRAPAGALYLWARAPEGTDTGPDSSLSHLCLEEKVIYVPGELCSAGSGQGYVRLTFGNLSPEELREAARRFVTAARRNQETHV